MKKNYVVVFLIPGAKKVMTFGPESIVKKLMTKHDKSEVLLISIKEIHWAG